MRKEYDNKHYHQFVIAEDEVERICKEIINTISTVVDKEWAEHVISSLWVIKMKEALEKTTQAFEKWQLDILKK